MTVIYDTDNFTVSVHDSNKKFDWLVKTKILRMSLYIIHVIILGFNFLNT
jgi:hypothetical protein